jgi:hypothetical protein
MSPTIIEIDAGLDFSTRRCNTLRLFCLIARRALYINNARFYIAPYFVC